MTNGRTWATSVILGLGLTFVCVSSAAAGSTATTQISGNAFGQTSGSVQVNVAAGDGNQQSNATSLATGHNAQASTDVKQTISGSTGSPGNFTASISGNAFRNASGLISVNEASGTDNAQANQVAISLAGLGGSTLSTNSLAQVTPGGSGSSTGGATAPSHDIASIKENAFADANGLIQINQVAGRSNATANQFALELNLGAHP
ncbi:MAG: hypothetical protein ACYCXT_06600 [Acidiferrobacteraceae bacterium]